MNHQADAVYIHIPFCKKICHYCAFNKYFYDGQPVGRYLNALDAEMGFYHLMKQKKMDTIYVGGGTPSCLNMQELEQLLESIQQRMEYNEATEYTFEVNPGELSLEKIITFSHDKRFTMIKNSYYFKNYGINKIYTRVNFLLSYDRKQKKSKLSWFINFFIQH